MNTLLLHVLSAAESAADNAGHNEPPCDVWLCNVQGVSAQGRVALADIAVQYPQTACVFFIPSAWCFFSSVSVSEKQLRQAQQSLAWLIEDAVGDDAENLHVISGPSRAEVIEADGKNTDAKKTETDTPILAINKHLLTKKINEWRALGLRPVAVLPDLMLCPQGELAAGLENNSAGSAWSVSDNNGVLTLRTGLMSGAALELNADATAQSALLTLMLHAAFAERRASPQSTAPNASQRAPQNTLPLTVFSENSALISAAEQWAAQHADVSVVVSPEKTIGASSAGNMSASDWIKHPANFLQGSMAASPSMSLPPALKVAAVFLAVAFSVQLFSEWAHYGYYRYHEKKSAAEATALYKQLFPQERRLSNLRRQFNEHVSASSGGASALPVLTQVAESLENTSLSAQRVDFSGGVLTLDVDAPVIGDLDNLKQKLAAQGLSADIVSANTQGGVVRGRLRIGGGA